MAAKSAKYVEILCQRHKKTFRIPEVMIDGSITAVIRKLAQTDAQ